MINTIKNFVFSGSNTLFLSVSCLVSYSAARNKIGELFIDRKHKTVIIRDRWWGVLKKIQFEWHSNHYLPELSLPETEQEKYKEMQQNLQQAIALETGLKFDTQQFLLQNKGKFRNLNNFSGSLKWFQAAYNLLINRKILNYATNHITRRITPFF